jgi:hypothetical protein
MFVAPKPSCTILHPRIVTARLSPVARIATPPSATIAPPSIHGRRIPKRESERSDSRPNSGVMIMITMPPTAATIERFVPFVASSRKARAFGIDAPLMVPRASVTPNQARTNNGRNPRACGEPGTASGSTTATGTASPMRGSGSTGPVGRPVGGV